MQRISPSAASSHQRAESPLPEWRPQIGHGLSLRVPLRVGLRLRVEPMRSRQLPATIEEHLKGFAFAVTLFWCGVCFALELNGSIDLCRQLCRLFRSGVEQCFEPKWIVVAVDLRGGDDPREQLQL